LTTAKTHLKEARYYEKKDDKKVRCTLCPHLCFIPDGGIGLCRARSNHRGKVYAESYGYLTSVALDPIEKKPLQRFSPGSRILSVGSYGCNMRCPFCQNFAISMASCDTVESVYFEPKQLIERALSLVPQGNIGLAYTYNEPLVSFEYVLDCAKLAHKNKLKNVLVTNGFVNAKPLEELLPYIDAMNIDLKSFSEGFYKKIGGSLGPVQATIKVAAKACHVELTTLIIPGENDSPSEIEESAAWIASLSPEIPLHLSRFFPKYKMSQKEATPVDELSALAAIARKHLNYVYIGNI
jgi:pyruvate formate lyase activating enzyme